ncbi:spermidine synthase [Legionella micdadei]|uniref:spermidine synthase n=1 Tax=Legionella micdadei TaxID=451 RepID=UPI0009EF796C|nr:fused MFS/spermidine synthase [Legionella micdadei]ARG98016.1 spermidine synthase [Legionella micdadei]ARG99665.1 spermidine synthase [Legionella micdadei]NSL19274.1 fused MFS/spermidine synthase [Legionella micdadei]
MTRFLFSIPLFLSALLLFVIQPIVAKLLLPVYGGTPAVWTICVLFFQTMLLLAYGYAWVLSRIANNWVWRLVHVSLVLLSLTALPLTVSPTFNLTSPDLAILCHLITHLGLPILVIGASAPLLQFAYSQTKAKYASDPYFFYVASNVGSLFALLAYPWIIERYIGLKLQFHYWNLSFVIYMIVLLAALFIPKQQSLTPERKKNKATWSIRLRWISYSFIPCSLMLGVSFYISTDIAATPLFWVIPLLVYLLSFIITFAKNPLIPHAWVTRNTLFFIIFPVIGFIVGANLLTAWALILFHLASLFMLALLCHGELVRMRPTTNQLTSFYFCIALGGSLAGLFNGVIAPRLFDGAYEYPLVFALAMLCFSLPRSSVYTSIILFVLLLINCFLPEHCWMKTHHILAILALGILVIWPKNKINLFMGMAILFVFLFSPWFKSIETLTQQRNFYGVKQVLSLSNAHVLVSQNTLHGFQLNGYSQQENAAMAYYGSVLPVVRRLQGIFPKLDATIIGLGTGMMACQFRNRDRLKIIDIDKQVIRIASNNHYFTYLHDCPPVISLHEGDGRKILEHNQDRRAHLLVIDAFSSDAIPTHLLTLEAFKLYQQTIEENGGILINISNRHLHLLPVVIAAGRELQLVVLHKKQVGNETEGKLTAEWALLTANQPLALELMRMEGWRFAAGNDSRLWTDDYSNIVPLIRWG